MILFLVGIAVSIPVGILVNLYTPWVRNVLANRNSVRRAKRIKAIKARLTQMDEFRAGKNSNKLVAIAATQIMSLLFFLSVMVAFTAVFGATYGIRIYDRITFQDSSGLNIIGTSSAIAAALSLVVASYIFFGSLSFFSSILLENNSYRKSALSSLRKLGEPMADADNSVSMQGTLEDKMTAEKNDISGPGAESTLSQPS